MSKVFRASTDTVFYISTDPYPNGGIFQATIHHVAEPAALPAIVILEHGGATAHEAEANAVAYLNQQFAGWINDTRP